MKLIPFYKLFLTLTFILTGVFFLTTTVFGHEDRTVGKYKIVAGFKNEPSYEGVMNAAAFRITSTLENHDHSESEHENKIDLVSHGAIFTAEIPPGGQYGVFFGEEFSGLSIPFHSHPSENIGMIMVKELDKNSNQSQKHSESHIIKTDGSGFDSPHVEISVGTEVKWANTSTDTLVIMSGLLTLPSGEAEMKHDGSQSVSGYSSSLYVEIIFSATGEGRVFPLIELSDDPGHYVADFIPTAAGKYSFRLFGNIGEDEINEKFIGGEGTFDEVQPSTEIQFPFELVSQRELQASTVGNKESYNKMSSLLNKMTILVVISLILGAVGIGTNALTYRKIMKR